MEHRTVEEHVAGLRGAVEAFGRYAAHAGADADVPTCPTWTVRKLLAHQGMIHRWARANLLGEECDPPTWNTEGQQVADPVAWLGEGADDLVATIGSVPDDVRAMVFLNDAPAPRVFWARRQCHETTIHAVDALAADLGRHPGPEDAEWIEPAVALDGIDELLTGFVTRGTSRFSDVGPMSFEVRPSEAHRAWSVEVQDDGAVVTTRLDGAVTGHASATGTSESADGRSVIGGSAVALYIALWNRAAPGVVDDPAEILSAVWQKRAQVRWR